jgi:hypothetical protein
MSNDEPIKHPSIPEPLQHIAEDIENLQLEREGAIIIEADEIIKIVQSHLDSTQDRYAPPKTSWDGDTLRGMPDLTKSKPTK